MASLPEIRLAIDIGGTFTDLVLVTPLNWFTTKVLTTHSDPASGVMTGLHTLLEEAAVGAQDVGLVLHGTTLATNALIERRGARTALITTAGHRDALEIGLENRFDQYDIFMQRPPVLVPQALRFTVDERLGANGQVLRPLRQEDVEATVEAILASGVESVAVGFLHAYVNPEHEREVGDALFRRAPHLALSLSSSVCPEIREYERLSTTCANAYVKPLIGGYLTSLAAQFGSVGMTCPVLLMTSGGGLTSLATAKEFPIRLVESGPAGGAMLAAALARRSDWRRVLAFDMGGTTAKLTLIDDFEPLWSRAFEVARAYRYRKGSGLPVRIPVIELVEIGAGGGSIARVDRLQRIHTGPDSAGSEPGPVAYGRGGSAPTVTDADLVLGKLPSERFADGSVVIDVDAARAAIDRAVAMPLRLDVLSAAWGISETVDENMAAAARSHASESGRSLAERTMIAFGGAAPIHAVSLAIKLGMSRVVIPRFAGVGSAVGFLLAPISFEVVRSRHGYLDTLDASDIAQLLLSMRAEAMEIVLPIAGLDSLKESCRAYMRYVGQGFEIAVNVPAGGCTAAMLALAFETKYREFYDRTIPGQRIEILSWTLGLSTAAPDIPRLSSVQAEPESSTAHWFDGTRIQPVRRRRREGLEMQGNAGGPLLVFEDYTTTVVPNGFDLRVDEFGQLVIQRTGEKGQ